MSIILFHSLLFIFVIYFNGLYFLKKILFLKEKRNFYETSLIGLIVTIFFAQFLNFLIPLNDYVILSNILFLFIFIFFNQNIFEKNFKINLSILIISLLLMLMNIYGSNFSDDLDHYHYGFIANIDNLNFIWGQSYLHPLYGLSPSWLIGHSFFNFNQFILQDIHILNGIVLFLVIGLLLSELDLNKDKKVVYNPILFSLLLFLLLKYTRIKEFGIDRPSTLIFCFLIYYYLKYFLTYKNKDISKNFILISLVSFFIFSIKIIYLPVLIFSLVIFIKNKSKLFRFDPLYLFLLFPVLIFISKNLLGTGCLFFPFEASCVKSIPWSNFSGAKDLSIAAEIFNKSWTSYTGDLSEYEYIKSFNWFKTWFERGGTELLELSLIILFLVIITLVIFFSKLSNTKLVYSNLKDFKLILLLIILIAFSIYLLKNPVIRMNHHMIISLMILIIILPLNLKLKAFKKDLVYIFLIIGFVFNLYKNFDRIAENNFINNPKNMILHKISEPKKKIINNFVYYEGWFGKSPIGNQNLDDKEHKRIWIFDILF